LGLIALLAPSTAFAADGMTILHWGNIDDLGGTTDVVSADWIESGHEPVNDDWAYVYDPSFYFFLTGSTTGGDRTAEFADKGYVIVAAAGDPGGNYPSEPSWFDFTNFSASLDPSVPLVDLAVSYQASFVPTFRGYQSYIVYTNTNEVSPSNQLVVYDSDHSVWPRTISGLKFGSQNYLLTGDGQEQQTQLITG
jgi:hypothetical protein